MDQILSFYLFLGQVYVERGTVLDSLILQTFMDTMLKSNPQTQQRSNHNGQEVVWSSQFLPSHWTSVTFTTDVLLPLSRTEFDHLSCGPFPDQPLVLRLWDEDGGHHSIPGEISSLYGSLLPDMYS